MINIKKLQLVYPDLISMPNIYGEVKEEKFDPKNPINCWNASIIN